MSEGYSVGSGLNGKGHYPATRSIDLSRMSDPDRGGRPDTLGGVREPDEWNTTAVLDAPSTWSPAGERGGSEQVTARQVAAGQIAAGQIAAGRASGERDEAEHTTAVLGGPGEWTAADEPVVARTWYWWVWLVVGILGGGLGLLPWLLTGMTSPLQNLWATDASPSDMPATLLPLSQYQLGAVAALLITGSAIAGLLARIARRRWSAGGFWALMGGVVLVQATAIVQSAVVIGSGVRLTVDSVAYLAVILLLALLTLLAGAAVLTLIARAPRAGALLGFAVAALPFAGWLAAYAPFVPLSQPKLIAAAIVVWLPAALIGFAIAWCGLDSVGRVLAAVLTLAYLWAAPVVSAAAAAAAGSRVFAHSPEAMVGYGLGVFRTQLFAIGTVLPPLALAVMIATVGLLLRLALSRVRRGRMPRPAFEY